MTDEIELDGNCRAKLEKAIAGAVQSCIAAHGPLTPSLVDSTAKRVIGAIKGYNKMAKETAQRKLQDQIIQSLNTSYSWYLNYAAGSSGRLHQRNKVMTITDFGRQLGALSNEQAFEIHHWESKWSAKPGPFRFGVDWRAVKPEHMRGVSNTPGN